MRQMDFDFDSVFKPNATQEDVYKEVAPFIDSFLQGSNVCIFAYGQTGSGKTFTMEGAHETRGIIPRSLENLFGFLKFEQYSTDAASRPTWELKVSVVDVYCEIIRDLLVTDGHDGTNGTDHHDGGRPHQRAEWDNGRVPASSTSSSSSSSHTHTHIGPGLGHGAESYKTVTSLDEVNEVLRGAYRHRVTSSTLMNASSSRSHMVLSLVLHVRHPGNVGEYTSRLHLIDLAGSERISRSGALNDSTQLKEAQAINKSLSALGDVINSLKRKAKHVPYRNSKLTQLLSAALGTRKSKTLMIATVSPDHDNASETVCSLKFANRVRTVELGDGGMDSAFEGGGTGTGGGAPSASGASTHAHGRPARVSGGSSPAPTRTSNLRASLPRGGHHM